MSIIKELWLAIVVVLVVAIIGSVSIYGVTTKHYVEEQLYAKKHRQCDYACVDIE